MKLVFFLMIWYICYSNREVNVKTKIIKIVLLIIMIISLINLFIWKNENNQTVEIITQTKKYIDIDDKNSLNPKIKSINKDIVGWLTVDNTNIDYPVVQANNNEYYLNHNLYKEYSSAGWVFMDSNNKPGDQNLVIYGHRRKDGSMFGSLGKLLNNKKPGKIKFITEDNTYYYNIFSVYKIEKDDNYRESNYNEFDKKLQEFKKRSIHNYNVDIENSNQIITLSTCFQDNRYRVVVHGIKIEEN